MIGQVCEIELRSNEVYRNPFTNIRMLSTITSPSGVRMQIGGFFDGDNTWKFRFSPNEPGTWKYQTTVIPVDEDLIEEGSIYIEPTDQQHRGFLRTTKELPWGFVFDSGDPCFLVGDTQYNLIGAAHCGVDVERILRHRRQQGYNIVRARVPVSPFCPKNAYNVWQNRSTWPWAGSPQIPILDRFNLAYFRSMDHVLQLISRLGMGVELILEGWGIEFPFNQRSVFNDQLEELWIRYVVSRYDAFDSIYMWDIMNEYIYYPHGKYISGDTTCDEWAGRMARLIKQAGPHGHPIAVHTMEEPEPTYAERLSAYPEIDVLLFQSWGVTDAENAWLAAGIDKSIEKNTTGALQVCILAEYGYEHTQEYEFTFFGFRNLTAEHTRRGAYRAVFSGLPVFAGFDNTWGPFMQIDPDPPGASQVGYLSNLFQHILPFYRLRPT